MSIRAPDVNTGLTQNAALKLGLPATACNKPPNTANCTFFFAEVPSAAGGSVFPTNGSHVLVAKMNGSSGTQGGRIVMSANGSIIVNVYGQSGSVLDITALTGLTPGKVYLIALIANPTNTYLCACEPGSSTVLRQNANAFGMYTLEFGPAVSPGRTSLWTGIFGGSTSTADRGFCGAFEEFNFYHGAFPETTAGLVPNETLIANIASGAQSFATLAGSLAGGSHRCRYRLRHQADLADATGNFGVATILNADNGSGRTLYSYGPLLPTTFTPDWSVDMVANCVFGTPGDRSTAFTNIRTVGGSYSGMTPLRIEARLMNRDGTELRTWTTVDDAPAAGRWALKANAFANVLMTEGLLSFRYRAIASDGTTVLAESPGYDLTGSGGHFVLDGQSQIYKGVTGGNAPNFSTNSVVVGVYQQDETLGARPSRAIMGSPTPPVASVKDVGGGSVRTAANEWNALYPGVPFQWSNFGQEGTPIQSVTDADVPSAEGNKSYYLRPRRLKAACGGLLQPFNMIWFGHSSGADISYASKLAAAVAWVEAEMGAPQWHIHIPVSRFANAIGGNAENVGSQANDMLHSRNGARAVCLAAPTRNKYFGNLSTTWMTQDDPGETTEDPHPREGSALGDGRNGACVGLAQMSVSRAIVDEPLQFLGWRAISGGMRLVVGRVNA